MEDFVHLHVHCETSLLDAVSRPRDLARKAASLGMPAIAITDHGSLTSALKFATACRDSGVKPIIGCEFYLALGSRLERNSIEVDNSDPSSGEGQKTKRYEHITLLAATNEGWRNLVALHNIAHNEDSYWYVPRIDYDLMADNAEGLICLTGCLGGPVLGPISRHLARLDKIERARTRLDQARDHGRAVVADYRAGQVSKKEVEEAQHAYTHAKRLLASLDDTEVRRRLTQAQDGAQAAIGHLKDLLSTDAADQLSIIAEGRERSSESEEIAGATAKAQLAYDDFHQAQSAYRDVTYDGIAQARENLARLVGIYGKDNVFVELMNHGIEIENRAAPIAVKLADELGVGIVATNDSHYTEETDADNHDAWLAMKVAGGLSDPARFRFHGCGYWVRTAEQMRQLRDEPWWQKACDTTLEIAARIEEWVLPRPGIHLPSFPVPQGYETTFDYFKDLVREGARKRYGSPIPRDVAARLARETRVIRDLGLINFFLIDHDLLSWARSDYTIEDWISVHDGHPVSEDREKKKPIVIGAGRGSSSGSAVLYCLGVVDVDPLEHGLYFERFLDPTRAGMPDVDTDFERERRDEGYAYLVARYGADRIARLGTIGRAETKAAIKNGCRLMGIPDQFANQLTKLVPSTEDGDMPLRQLRDPDNKAAEPFQAKAARYVDNVVMERALDLAQSFEGLASSEGVHACGVLISDAPIDRMIPTRRDRKNADPNAPRVTTWDGRDIDSLGLLKLDLLGVRTLDIIHTCLETVGLTMSDIPSPSAPESDPAWRLLQAGDTAGVFQLASSGITELVEAIKPSQWAHLTAINALYRPGPLKAGMHTLYADRLNGRADVDYSIFSTDPDEIEVIKDVLGETFGIPVYQEQAMELGRVVAGFGDSGVNRLRKAISKKKVAEFPQLGKLFIEGAQKNVTDDGNPKQVFAKATAAELWKALEGSAHYSFNKSHSAAYGLIGYQTAYLKAVYPAAFAAAVLTHTPRGGDNNLIRSSVIRSATNAGVEIMPASINDSLLATWAPDEHTILLGLGEIKDVGAAAEAIVAERAHGPFTCVADLVGRVTTLTSTNLVALAEAGAFDQWGSRLGHVMVSRAIKKRPDTRVPQAEWGPIERWAKQVARIGLGFGQHPIRIAQPQIESFSRVFDSWGRPRELRLKPLDSVLKKEDGAPISNVVGVVSAVTFKAFSSGRAAFVTFEDESTTIEGALWSNTLVDIDEDDLFVGAVLAIDGKAKIRTVDTEDGQNTKAEITVSKIERLQVPSKQTPDHVAPLETAMLTVVKEES